MTANYQAGEQAHGPWQRGGCGPLRGWHPVEILAMVLGFAIWWPIGLAVLAWKFAQKRGYPMPDVMAAARARFSGLSGFDREARARWRPFEQTTGNAAFDEWRKAEMDKLEEERRKLDQAERDFAAHKEDLRRARDREEFDRFMAARRGPAAS